MSTSDSYDLLIDCVSALISRICFYTLSFSPLPGESILLLFITRLGLGSGAGAFPGSGVSSLAFCFFFFLDVLYLAVLEDEGRYECGMLLVGV